MKIANEHQLLSAIARTLPPVRRVLAFAPHPDDEIFGCGGTLALMQAAGMDVQVHILTDGALGGAGDDATLVARREAESCAAATLLGLPAPCFWRLPDRGLRYGEPLVMRIQEAIAGADAELVLLPAVTELHPDHQTLALAGAEAVRRLGGARQAAFYEIGNALAAPTLLIDISTVVARKLQAMQAFASQLTLQPYADRISGLNRYRAHLLAGEAHSAEAFLLATAQDLAGGLAKLFEGAAAHRHRLGFAADPADLPLVSVIVRSMDRPSLDRALDSIASQTYPHIEVIVVNAKGAGHRPLDSHCGHSPLRLVGDGSPLARSRAANAGLESAQGKYLIFLDDDDLFLPHHIAALVAELEGLPDHAAIYSAVKLVNQDGVESGVLAEPFDKTQLYLANYLPINAVLFRRDIVDRGIRFDDDFDMCEDWDFWLQAAEVGPLRCLNQVGAVYNIDNAAGSRVRMDVERSRNAAIAIYKKWIQRLDDTAIMSVVDYALFKKAADLHYLKMKQSGIDGDSFDACIESAINTCRDINALRYGFADLEQRYNDLQQRYKDLQLQNAESLQSMKNILAESQQKLTEVISSKSWKITYPLRYSTQVFRKLFGRYGD